MKDERDRIYEALKDLNKYSKKELEQEIIKIKLKLEEIKKQKALETRPKRLDKPNWEKVCDICERFLSELEEYGMDEDDNNSGFFEEIMEVIYGKNVIDYLYKNYRR